MSKLFEPMSFEKWFGMNPDACDEWLICVNCEGIGCLDCEGLGEVRDVPYRVYLEYLNRDKERIKKAAHS